MENVNLHPTVLINQYNYIDSRIDIITIIDSSAYRPIILQIMTLTVTVVIVYFIVLTVLRLCYMSGTATDPVLVYR